MNLIKGWNKKIIHPFTFGYIFVAAYFDVLYLYLVTLVIVCFHEYCHFLMAKYFHFEIGKIRILPFGVFMELCDFGVRRIDQEAVVILAGLCSHAILFLLFRFFGLGDIYFSINRVVFLFNLLPIYPLDGSKLLLLFFCIFMDYKEAIKLQIKVSFLVLSLLVILFFDVSGIVVFGYLFICCFNYVKEYRYIVLRLYLNRSIANRSSLKKLNRNYCFYRFYHNYYLTKDGFVDEIFMLEELISCVHL